MVQIEASEHLRLSFDPPDPLKRHPTLFIFLGGSPFSQWKQIFFLTTCSAEEKVSFTRLGRTQLKFSLHISVPFTTVRRERPSGFAGDPC